jgi:hypothetical protein
MEDPRPDLIYDTELWTKLLNMAESVDEQLAYTLHGFRCAGARLVKTNAGYSMRPEFNKESLWDNQAEYERDKQQFLVKYGKTFVSLLDRLESEDEL